MSKLLEHKQKKAYKVQGWDIISTCLGIAGTLMTVVSAIQPKNPINIARLPMACLLFSASVVAERMRDSDLLSLDRATEYEKSLTSDRVRLDTVINEGLHKLQIAEEAYLLAPVDRHGYIAELIGVAPPNYAARQVDPITQSLQQPEQSVQSIELNEPDPTGNFDPEQDLEKVESVSSFIPAVRVSDWFQEMAKLIPESLVQEWKSSPGSGISIDDGIANIVRRKA